MQLNSIIGRARGAFAVLAALCVTFIAWPPRAARAGIDEWTSNGPGVEPSVRALAVDATSPSTIYAGTSNGGVFKSTDGGASWTAMNGGLTNTWIFAIAIHPTDPAVLYAGAATVTFPNPGGVFRSTDGGASWSGTLSAHVVSLAIDPVTPSTIYAGGTSAVYKSTDDGANWSLVGDPIGEPHHTVVDLAIDPATPATVYAAVTPSAMSPNGGVFKSVDGGATWMASNSGLTDVSVSSVAIDPTVPSTIYVTTIGGGGGVFKSVDGATTWQPANVGLAGHRVYSLAIDGTTPSILYAGTVDGTGVSRTFRSTDGGASWFELDPPEDECALCDRVVALAIDPTTSRIVYAGNHWGVFQIEQSDEFATRNVGAGGTLTTDTEMDGATPVDVVETAVTTPNAGGMTISEQDAHGAPPSGYTIIGQQISLAAPPASASSPLTLAFTLDGSVVPPSESEATIAIFRNGVLVPPCTGSPSAIPDPCVSERTTSGDDVLLTVLTSQASDWTFGIVTPTPTPTPTATATPLCGAAPDVCRTPVVSQKSLLTLVDRSPSETKDQLQWKWLAGASTGASEFGNPLASDDYVLCLYHGGSLLASLLAPAGGTCAGKPCWASKPKGFQYKDKDGTPNGINQLQLNAGADGKAKIQIKGKGLNLPDSDLSNLVSPLTVQLKRSGGGACFAATYTFPPATKNDGVTFKDKAD